MLIDFSDLLQVCSFSPLGSHDLVSSQRLKVNVFELGHTYLQLVQTLNLRLPLIDPSHYISRFAALLEFGDETPKVSTDAVRLIQRFDRDWMTKGRRPAGICGAALLLAARMNNFRRSVEEIVQVVKIADSTVRKRLEEFKGTRSGELTVADFRSVWLEEEMDPPAFVKGKEREREETEAGDADEEVEGGRGKQKAGKKKKRKRGEEIEVEQTQEIENALLPRQAIDPALLNEGILAGAMDPTPPFLPDDHDSTDANIDPSLLPRQPSRTKSPDMSLNSTLAPPTDIIDESANTIIAQEVATFLQNTQGAMLSSVLDEAEERRLAQITVIDDLMGLDEDELDRFILSEDEVKIKERVWVELNKEYLEAIAGESILQGMFYQSLLLNGCLLHSERGTERNGRTQSQE